jgi:hypothetical protein
MFKIRYRIQTLQDNHWVIDKGTFKITNDLDYFISIIEMAHDNRLHTFKFKRSLRWRVFDYELGKVVYE